jgi:GT2 family glycosyltransferase
MADAGRLGCVVVTYDALPWIEQCLESVAALDTVVVDNGSRDDTVAFVRERFPTVRVVESENRGLAAGWNLGVAETSGEHVLILNADAWLVADAAEQLLAASARHPRAALVGPRLLNTDGSLQRSVRGFPTLWRIATEYLYLRKLAPRTAAFNAFYAGGFDHDRVREADFLMAACLLVRREATDEVGMFDESYFMFSEEVDWCYRFHETGWKVVFLPEAEVVHVGGASGMKEFDPMFLEQVRGHLRFLAAHKGMKEAERARLLFLAGLKLRAWFFPGDRRATYRGAFEGLRSSSVPALLHSGR